MRFAGGQHDLTHDERTILASAVREDARWLEDTVGIASICLQRGATVESPFGQLIEAWEGVELFHHGLAAEVGHRCVAVQPEVFQFEFGHRVFLVFYG